MTVLASAVAIGDTQLIIDAPFSAGQIPGWVKIDTEMLYAGGQHFRTGTTLTLSSPATATHSNGATVTYAGRPYDADFRSATGGGGGGAITVDNTIDAPVEVTSLVLPSARTSGGTAYMRPVILSETDPSDVSWVGDENYDGVLWLQLVAGVTVKVALRVWDSTAEGWQDAGIGDMVAGNSFEMTGYSANGTEGNATFTFGGNPDGAINLHLKDEDGANDRHYRLLMGNDRLELSYVDPDAASPDNSVVLDGTGITLGATWIIFNGSAGFNGSELGFYGSIAVTRPEVPASPTAQNVVDALVALGLITQAA